MKRTNLTAFLVITGLTSSAWPAADTKTTQEKYESGAIKAEYSTDANNTRNGPFKTFFETGKVKESGSYKDGVLDGSWTKLDEASKLLQSIDYVYGKKSGMSRDYEKGVLIKEEFYVDDLLVYPGSVAAITATLAEIRKSKVPTAVPDSKHPPLGPHKGTPEPAAELEAGMRLLKEYRYLCGRPYEPMELDETANAYAEAAAALCRAVQGTDSPSAQPWLERFRLSIRRKGAQSSNLHRLLGATAVTAVHGFMWDRESNNLQTVGHRIHCLEPFLQRIGFGKSGNNVAMWVDDASRDPAHPTFGDFVAYLPPGYFPNTHIVDDAPWSVTSEAFGLPDVKKVKVSVKNVKITVSPPTLKIGKEMQVNNFHVNRANLIFQVENCSTQAGTAYIVEMTGLEYFQPGKPGQPRRPAPPISYVVQFYRPTN